MRFVILPVIFSCLALLVSSAPVSEFYRAREIIARSAPNPVARELAHALLTLYERTTSDATIKLGTEEFKLKKLPAGEQGESSEVFQVESGPHAGAFAKKKVTEQEIEATKAVGEAITSGKDEGVSWLIIKKSPGKELDKTTKFAADKANAAKCKEHVAEAVKVGIKKIGEIAHSKGWLHDDPHVHNILFDDHLTEAHLIDWGKAKKVAVGSTPNLSSLQAVMEQQFAHLCRSAAPPPPPPKKKVGKRAYDFEYY
ncbi:uncharacterized protein C8Q71DRAFT_771905 [Rhodofomes roseus]|uniref:Protein kinase domain-containing protein n=1 Tax=Rhodofomes roseus TaxID=34475 RepID=A0A4Y9YM16_9APHY|nr:uncharacterized protein C8Q71DRAFT_771905 [Rhodofomes roseus]KAH9833650.1 hypothetical protein C8Q71DRAFT_771905 [Rhodofomes roseus]TFY63606.1 hypothetical protein EVJ58_g3148 [Rhodofomes roseus]